MTHEKHGEEWTDFLTAESSLPADEMTFSTGSNWGLDGYDFDVPDNAGGEDAARLPETRGLAQLPDGMVQAATPGLDTQVLMASEDGMPLDVMLSEEEGALSKDASVVDLQWLDPTQEQDPNRLPDQSYLDSVSQLEDAWGTEDRTTGISLTPNKDLEVAQYEESLHEGPKSGLPGARTAEEVRDAVMRAVRRAHFGHKMAAIKQELVDLLGYDAVRTKRAVQMLEEDHGLVSNVFVRAAAFPGIKNGKWVKELKRAARTARYVITNDEAVAIKLGMQMVQEVPWKEALSVYRPLIVAAGQKVASGDPKAALRRAFLQGVRIAAPDFGFKPIVKPAVASQEQARTAVAAAAAAPKSVVVSAEDRAKEAKYKQVMVQLARLVKTGRLSQAQAFSLVHQHKEALPLLKSAAAIMAVPVKAETYAGTGNLVSKEAEDSRQPVHASQGEQKALVEAAAKKKVLADISHRVKVGQLSADVGKRIAGLKKTAAELQHILVVAVQRAAEFQETPMKPTKSADYQGPVQNGAPPQVRQTVVPTEQARILQAAKNTGIKSGEFVNLLRYARQQMSEGWAGGKLSELLTTRFSPPLLKAASGLLAEARKQQEGLSGHLYVDASAYASPDGDTGCRRGALKHRTNSLKFVLAMDRCKTCTANSDGTCSQYNKKLASKPPIKDAVAYQKKMLHLADAPDEEQTAALFNQSEYDLQGEVSAEFDLQAEMDAADAQAVDFGNGPEL